MRISGNLYQTNHSFLNANNINRSLSRKNQNAESSNGGGKQDRVSISPRGGMMNLIENLTKQKEAFKEKKSDLVRKTMDNGGDMDSIKSQLDFYTEQMENIDKQISDLYAQQAKEAIEKKEEKKSDQPKENKTEEELETERLSKLANVSDGVKQTERISAVQSQVEGELHVRQSEINLGEIRVDRLESELFKGGDQTDVKALIAHEEQLLDNKREAAAELEDKVSQIGLSQGEKLREAVEELTENRESEAAEDEKRDPLNAAEPNTEQNAAADPAGRTARGEETERIAEGRREIHGDGTLMN